jgi:hypothetical protein
MSCFVCDKKTTSCCVNCKQIHYCSRECQKNNWLIHKKECAELSASSKLFEVIKSAIGDEINAAISLGDVEINITESWEEFSTNMYFPHFAHIKISQIKHGSTHNICVIKFNDITMKNYMYVDTKENYISSKKEQKNKKGSKKENKPMRSFNADEIVSVYFEIF